MMGWWWMSVKKMGDEWEVHDWTTQGTDGTDAATMPQPSHAPFCFFVGISPKDLSGGANGRILGEWYSPHAKL